MPHFECGAFNRSATSPAAAKDRKKAPFGRRYVTKRAKTDKGEGPNMTPTDEDYAPCRPAMPNILKSDRVRAQLRGIFLTFCLVLATTGLIYAIILEVGLTRGTVAYLIPVLIAAIRWGLIASLFAAACGVLASAFFFFPPLYTLQVRDPQEAINLILYLLTAFVVSQLATRLKRQLEVSRQREIDMRDLYAFSRRLAVAFDVSDIHAAIEDHLAAVMQRTVVLFPDPRSTTVRNKRRDGVAIPEHVLAKVIEVGEGRRDAMTGVTVKAENGEVWLIRTVAGKKSEFHVIAVNLGRASKQAIDDLRSRVDAALVEATATLDRLGIANAISEARMRAETEQLREALIGSVSHELRTPLASILGAATVLSAAPALQNEKKLRALVHDVRDEAERLNNDIQNLLDATRISSDGVKPRTEWADPADIVNSAIERCRRRFADRRVSLDVPADLPLIHVDAVLVQQALVQIFDNAVKYSLPGSHISIAIRAHEGCIVLSVSDEGAGLTDAEQTLMWDRFVRGDRHVATTSGSGLGLWIANAFIAANGGKIHASSDGPGLGSVVAIELPVIQASVPQLEADADE
jgi:two-component system sensor histidine kinase KdpD